MHIYVNNIAIATTMRSIHKFSVYMCECTYVRVFHSINVYASIDYYYYVNAKYKALYNAFHFYLI